MLLCISRALSLHPATDMDHSTVVVARRSTSRYCNSRCFNKSTPGAAAAAFQTAKVARTEVDGRPVSSFVRVVDQTAFCIPTQRLSLRREEKNMVKWMRMPVFRSDAAAGDASHLNLPLNLPEDGIEEGRKSEDHKPRRGGPIEWFRNAVSRQFTQKEELINNLKRYGVAGVLSYGLLNTAYYLVTFLFVWFYAPPPGGLGFIPAAQRFLQVFATVWAVSQVTKVMRALGALSIAPSVDKGLNWFTQRFNFKSRGTAFSFVVGLCFGLAALMFLTITVLWA